MGAPGCRKVEGPLPFDLDGYRGATCSSSTTLDALVPGIVKEGVRSVWELGDVEVYDGGSDGVASTQDNRLFLKQGVFAL